jgi:hypothetical protein
MGFLSSSKGDVAVLEDFSLQNFGDGFVRSLLASNFAADFNNTAHIFYWDSV